MVVKNLFGTDFTIPADGATDWGPDVRNLLVKMVDALDNMAAMTTSEIPFLVLPGVASVIGNDDDLAITNPRHDLISSGGKVNLGSLKSTIAGAAIKDGQTLLLVGQDNTKTVELDSDEAGGNWVINGDIILGENDAIFLVWDLSATKWVEVSRNN